ncbi:hypothetical protein TNCV_4163201 [Trichonephila clavipes]|nr:hypothetical protein TNCV_4163201 [Trichonephila clavipes]
MLLDRSGQGKVYQLISRRRFQQMEVLEGQNILVSISGKKSRVRVYYLSWLKSKILRSDGDIEFVRSLVENALEKSKQEAEIQLEKFKLSQIEKQLELAKVRKESEKNPQTLENGEPSSITDKLESLDKTRNPTPTSNLNLDASTFVPGQIERSVEANSQSQFVVTGFEKGRLKNMFLSTVRTLVKNTLNGWRSDAC